MEEDSLLFRIEKVVFVFLLDSLLFMYFEECNRLLIQSKTNCVY